MMKQTLCLICVLLLISLFGCTSEKIYDDNNYPAESVNESISASYAALKITSFEEIAEETKKATPDSDIYNLNELVFYYVPAEIIVKSQATLNAIFIKDRYVSIHYDLNKLPENKSFKDIAEAEAARLTNTIKLVWTRNADGEKLLCNTIETLNLSQLGDSTLYYYTDISLPSSPDIMLCKSIYWVNESYMFCLNIPMDLYKEWIQNETETMSISELTALTKVDVVISK